MNSDEENRHVSDGVPKAHLCQDEKIEWRKIRKIQKAVRATRATGHKAKNSGFSELIG